MATDSGHYTVLMLLDLSTTYDTVDHKVLINRLKDTFGIATVYKLVQVISD